MANVKQDLVLEVLRNASYAMTAYEIGVELNLPKFTASESMQYPLAALLAKGEIKKARDGRFNVYEIAEE